MEASLTSLKVISQELKLRLKDGITERSLADYLDAIQARGTWLIRYALKYELQEEMEALDELVEESNLLLDHVPPSEMAFLTIFVSKISGCSEMLKISLTFRKNGQEQ